MQKAFTKNDTPQVKKLTQEELIKSYVAPKISIDGKEVMRSEWKVASLLKRGLDIDIDIEGDKDFSITLTKDGRFSLTKKINGGLEFFGNIFSLKSTIKTGPEKTEKEIMRLVLSFDKTDKNNVKAPVYYNLNDIKGTYIAKDGTEKPCINGFNLTKWDKESKKEVNYGHILVTQEEEPEDVYE